MALLIDSSLNLVEGITVDQAYLRLEYNVSRFGDKIVCGIFPYYNRAAYDVDKNASDIEKGSNILKIDQLSVSQVFTYDQEQDGDNVLKISHDNVKAYLSTDLTKEVPVLDPSTGDPVIDPSTGQPEYITVVVREKFADADKISVVDVSLG